MNEEYLIYWPQYVDDYYGWVDMDVPEGTVYMNKDGRFIYLYKKEEPNRYFKYDLANKNFYRVNIYKTRDDKVTKVKVPNIRKWFTKHQIVTDDPVFARVFLYNKTDRTLAVYKNPVRYIEAFNRVEAQALEEWYKADVKIAEVEKMFDESQKNKKAHCGRNYVSLKYRPCDFSKESLRFLKSQDEVSYKFLDQYQKFSDEDMIIYKKLYEFSQKPEYDGCFEFQDRLTNYSIFRFGTWDSDRARERIIECIKEFNLDIDALCRFLMRLKRVEGCDLGDLTDGYHYRDYLRMEKTLNNENLGKVDKYPKNWLTTFRRTKRNYDDIRKRIDEKKFKEEVSKHQDLLYNDKKFSIVLPEKAQDVRQEGAMLKHCVASYVDRIANGQTCIVFCRDNVDTAEPYVTVEVKNGAVTQAYGYQDSKPEKDALKFLAKWAKEKDLTLSWRWEKDFRTRRGR